MNHCSPDWDKDAAAEADTARWSAEAQLLEQHDAVAVHICLQAGLDASSTTALLARLVGWLRHGQPATAPTSTSQAIPAQDSLIV